jgi:hypothetical protein
MGAKIILTCAAIKKFLIAASGEIGLPKPLHGGHIFPLTFNQKIYG